VAAALQDVAVHPAVVQGAPEVGAAVDDGEQAMADADQKQVLGLGAGPLHPEHGAVAHAEDLRQRARPHRRGARRVEHDRARRPGLFLIHGRTHTSRFIVYAILVKPRFAARI